MPSGPFISYAQNAEDVVLRRALGHVVDGRYLDVGAFDPEVHSVTRQLYAQGWRGLNLEPVPALYEAFVNDRPEDVNLQVAAGSAAGVLAFHVVRDTGLSTLRGDIAAGHAADGREVEEVRVAVVTLDDLIESHLDGLPLHVLKIDVEGAEADVLAGLDLVRHRPWVLLVEATVPLTTEPSHYDWEPRLLAGGYEFALFDGLSRWYVASEHSAELMPTLCYPACVLDDYQAVGPAQALSRATQAERTAQVWRSAALEHAILERELHEQLFNQRDEIAGTRLLAHELVVSQAELAEARWQGGLLDEERAWLRGLLAEQAAAAEAAQAHVAQQPPGQLDRTVRRMARVYRRLSDRRTA